MLRLAFITASLMIGAPALAQDLPSGGILDLPQHGRSTVTSYMPYNQTKARRTRSQVNANNRTARTCANVPSVRARLGADNLKVQQLARLCRQAGY
ncbi:hypothetical protein [Sphingomonas lenta]|uniref:hypothetical protein n=1 Tax=Sphingomonas lenta TaxID=1141887 RepID=UPI001140C038|nr:hypothetical protein [Sphingomonas lenta]